jgi:hypothetical protein
MQFSKPQSDRQHLLATACKPPDSSNGRSFKRDLSIFFVPHFPMSRESLGKQSFSVERRFFATKMHRAFRQCDSAYASSRDQRRDSSSPRKQAQSYGLNKNTGAP